MTNEVTSIGVGMETDGIERGIRSLKTLAEQGPKVEQAMAGVERVVKTAGKTLEGLRQSAPDLSGVAAGAAKAGAALGGLGNATRSTIKNSEDLRRALDSLGATEEQYIRKLMEEAKTIGMGRGDREAYLAQSRGMSASAQEVARAIGNKIQALKAEQAATVGAVKGAKEMASANEVLAGNMKLAVRGVQALLGLQVVSWAKESAVALFSASAAAERLRTGLDFSSARGSADEIAYLRKTTHALGLQFQSTALAYMQFQAAAKGTSLEGEKARAVFESVAKASTVMGLSAEQSSGVLLALQQMVSKGTVQAEELRGQLGERLPGSLQIAARAMGVTTAEFGKMLEQGQLLADDFLPKFAKELESSLGGAAEKAAHRLDAATNRFIDAWDRLKQNVGDSGVSKAAAEGMSESAESLNAISLAMEQARIQGAGFWGQMGAAIGVMHDLTSVTERAKVNMYDNAVATAEAQKELERLQRIAATQGTSAWLLKEIGNVQRYIGELQQARREKDALQSGALVGAYTEGMGTSKTIVQQRAKFEASEQFLLSKSAETSGVTKKFIDDLAGYAAALDSGAMSATAYAAAITDLNKKRYESSEAGKAEAKALKAGAGEAKAAENSYQGLLKAVNEHMAAVKLQMDGSAKLTESQKLQIKYDELLARGKQGASAATIALVQAQIAALAVLEKEQKAIKLNVAGYQEYLALQDELADDYVKQAKAKENLRLASDRADLELQDQIARIELEAQMLGRTAEARQIAVAQLDAEIERRKELEALAKNLDLDESVREEERIRIHERYAKKVALAQRKAYVSEWEKTSQLIGDTLADYIMGGGKDAATYLKRLFSTLVLQPVVQYGVQSLLGAVGMGGSGGTGSSIGGMYDLFSKGKSITSIFGGTSMANTVGAGYANMTGTGIDGLLATNGAYGTAGGASGTAGSALGGVMSYAGYAAAIAYGMKLSAGAFDEGYRLKHKNYLSAHALTGGVAPITLSLDTSILSKLGFSERTANIITGASLWAKGMAKLGIGSNPKQHSGGVYTNTTSRDGALDVLGLTKHARGDFTSRQNGSIDSALASTIEGLVSVYEDLGARSETEIRKLAINAAFAINPINKKEDAYGYLSISDALTGAGIYGSSRRDGGGLGNDPEQAFNLFTGEIAGVLVQELIAADLPGWIDSILAGMGGNVTIAGLQSALLEIAKVDAAFAGFAKHIDGMQDLAGSVQTVLLSASGGVDALTANVSSYYDNFYTASEKLEDQAAALEEVFSKYGTTMPTTAAQFRALMEQQLAAGDAGAEFAAVLLGINGAFKEVADAWETELGGMSTSVKDFFADMHASIASLSADVAGSRKDILRGTTVMTADEIRAAIAGTAITGPSVTGIDVASASTASAAQALTSAQSIYGDYANTAATQLAKLHGLQAQRDASIQQREALAKEVASAGKWVLTTAYNPDADGTTRTHKFQAADTSQQQVRIEGLTNAIAELDAALAAQQSAYASASAEAATYAASVELAKNALAEAQKAEVQAKADFAAEVAQFVIDAGTSVDSLSGLRGEVVSFYEAQVQAVQAMLQSSGNIRGIVDQLRLGQLTTAQTAAELGNRYAVDYAMALATTGSTRAGYVDAMAGNLGGLTEALKAESLTAADWRIETAKLFAQASNAAGLLEGDAESDDYKDVALGLLDSIDTALAGLSDSTKSAERVIADAISQGTQAQLSGLRAIVAALQGQPIPAFAVGTNYVPRDMVAQIHEGEAIVPKAFNPWAGGGMPSGGGDTAALVAEIRELRKDQRAQASKMVQLQQDTNRMLVRWDSQGMPEEREVA